MNFKEVAAFTIHDVKNRLAVLAGRAEEKGDRETLKGVLEAAETLTRLLAYYKADEGQLTVNVDARVPADVITELALEVGKQTTLNVSTELAEAPTLWFYDESLVRMVLLHALYNALRHARQQVRLSVRVLDDWLEFGVHDDGPGFPEAMLGRQVAVQALSREGTGLGLHLADRVAAFHSHGDRQGYVDLANEGGAVFRLRLPK